MMPDSLLQLRFNTERVMNRNYDEMVGLCKGIIADGTVNQAEAEFLLNWLASHEDVSGCFPGNKIATRLCAMLEDGHLDTEESEELRFLLQGLTGEQGQQAKGACPTSLAFDDPMPGLEIEELTFCLTGTFQSGQRKQIESMLDGLGAGVSSGVVKSRPCCLVVGSLVTEAWIYSTHGRKMERAVEYRSQGAPVCVISEDHLWSELERLRLL